MAESKRTGTVEFYECEHQGDVDMYAGDIVASGGRIIRSELNGLAEVCRITFELQPGVTQSKFKERFKQTDAWHFRN